MLTLSFQSIWLLLSDSLLTYKATSLYLFQTKGNKIQLVAPPRYAECVRQRGRTSVQILGAKNGFLLKNLSNLSRNVTIVRYSLCYNKEQLCKHERLFPHPPLCTKHECTMGHSTSWNQFRSVQCPRFSGIMHGLNSPLWMLFCLWTKIFYKSCTLLEENVEF